ncbi:acetyltransferase [Microbacterium mangrovi]|uniref:Acetyltransferase n=1 Tax=Microbacterium mangrovi TaxID=1348253 RepID=A0A0B2A2S4_9MICO|nr:GNAT family N-acetyltransferase [Microbacterium mangrovi]KHK95873.1 acetyltransferase [Microbacterium mangrovi]
MDISVRRVAASDEAEWARLYAGYRAFYRLPEDPTVVASTWAWVRDEQWQMTGLVAEGDGRLVGLANLRWFARPSAGRIGLYLDDLFTAPESRGAGAATALLREASRMAAERDAQVVRWITASDNATARRLYDRHATATAWVTYDMAPAL